jgi:hypothetical protein
MNSRVLLATTLLLLPGCGLEACFFIGDFEPTPPPQAVLRGSIGDLPDGLMGRLAGTIVTARAISVDGAILAEGFFNADEGFELPLGPDRDHFNVRVVLTSGELVLKQIVTSAPAGVDVPTGEVGLTSTAATIVVERYAVRERANLASTPIGTVAEVLETARSDDPAVTAFRDLVAELLAAVDPSTGEGAFETDGFNAKDAALAAIGSDGATYSTLLEAAVDASLVPVVCDPSRALVMFTVDVSGLAKDGNGATQFIRQPTKEGKVFLGITLDPTSPVPDSAAALAPRLTPNDLATEMFDDGTNGDEVAADGVFTLTLPLPRGMRVLYKYTNGSAGEGFTGTEEWPGNARILIVDDVLTSSVSGAPDCVVVRRDSFGDEASNKNFVNLHARKGGGALSYSDDLGGKIATAPEGDGLLRVGGLALADLRSEGPLTPEGVPEARENGICGPCPAPLTVSAEDDSAPTLVASQFLSTEETRVVFSEDVDIQSAGSVASYLLVDADNRPIALRGAQVTGAVVVVSHDATDPRRRHTLYVKDVSDASLAQNPIADGAFIRVGPDQTPPVVLEVRPGSIVEVNPSARPANPETGEVVVVTFSEVLDRVSAENASNYEIAGLSVYAAFQRGRDVLLVTETQTRNEPYALLLGSVFDVAGNLLADDSEHAFRGLSLAQVTFRAIVDFAWRSVDGTERGLPPGADLWLTGTVQTEARDLDGGDLRTSGRTDIAGVAGYRFEPTGDEVDGGLVYALSLRLPAGTYAYKLAHGTSTSAIDPPTTLETVTKNLSTRNDVGGVSVNPITMLGKDGQSYLGARLSLSGSDEPALGVLFKRENPDEIVVVGSDDVELPIQIVGTWRDVPFGEGADYDDGLTELPLLVAGEADTTPPRLLSARARDSESVLLSFDEAVDASPTFTLGVSHEGAPLAVVETLLATPIPNQIVVRTGAMAPDTAYSVLVNGVRDALGNTQGSPVTAGFTSPSIFTPYIPIIDETPPVVVLINPTGPREIEVRFSERLADASVTAAAFALSSEGADPDPVLAADGVRIAGGGRNVILTVVDDMERQAPYRLSVNGISDVAGNVIVGVSLPFLGFGEFDPPVLEWARAVTPNLVALKFNEIVTSGTASNLTNYVMTGVEVSAVRFAASDEIKNAAFNTSWAPLSEDIVLLTTTTALNATSYTVTVTGVTDRSGNPSLTEATFTGVTTTPTVDVVLSYLISDTAVVLGVGAGGSPGVPARAISPGNFATQREGIFLLGTALTQNGASPILDHPFTTVVGGFPADGAPLDGVELELSDDGQNGDIVAGDGIYSVRIPDVPLGSTLSWKGFASFDKTWADANPEVPGTAFADAQMGPAAFGDGQEYPGNDNAVFIVADENDDGTVRIEHLFGDEISFKRKTGFPAFHMVTDFAKRRE